MKFLSSALFLFFMISIVFAQNEKPIVVLKGFDPVALVAGKEINGKEKFVDRARSL